MDKENNYCVLKEVKFVIATLSSPTMYLYKKPGEYKYKFFKSVNKALFTTDRNIAQMLLNEYQQVTGDDIELVVIPVVISYNLIDESEKVISDEDI